MNYRGILALDLDDTLLRSDISISLRTRAAIRKAEAAGFLAVLASGRMPYAMQKFVRFLGMDKRPGYIISGNGTIIRESRSGDTIYEASLRPELALMVYDLADAEGFPVQIYEDDTIYVSRRNEFADADVKMTGLKLVLAEDFRAMVKAGPAKLLIPGDPHILKPLQKLLENYLGGDLTLFTSKPFFLEVLPANCHKGTALKKVAAMLEIPRESVIAVGDSMNDEGMIRWAGLGVCMKNGDDRIKEIADMVTKKTNDEDGLASFIEEYILGPGDIPEMGNKGVIND